MEADPQSESLATDSLDLSADRGVWTRPTLQFGAAGTTGTAPSTSGARRSISCCDPTAASPQHRRSSARHPLRIRAVRAKSPSTATCRVGALYGDCAESIRSGAPWKSEPASYLNNIVEQDQRAIKRRCASMMGFKSFYNASITLAGVELAHRIRKRQFSFGRGRPPRRSMTMWALVMV